MDSLIGKNTTINGNVCFSGGLHIDGKICGNVKANDDGPVSLTISEQGHITGDIEAPNITVNGKLEGNIYCSNQLHLLSKAKIIGNVYYHSLEMASGAEINGCMEHGTTKIEALDDKLANKSIAHQKNDTKNPD